MVDESPHTGRSSTRIRKKPPSPKEPPAVVGPAIGLGAEDRLEIDLTGIDEPLLGLHDGLLGASRLQRGLKRTLDLVGATLALILLSPVLLTVAICVKLTSPGPVLYSQVRVGEGGRRFVLLKFRTMRVEADAMRKELEDRNESDGPVFKIKDDPRITEIGRCLRHTSLDELPQLFHVLNGKMSLVGPRPPLPEEVTSYNWWELQRLLVKPGLTCIWQVSGRSDVAFQTWVRMDIEYIRTWRLQRDIELLARTLPAVLSGRGAY